MTHNIWTNLKFGFNSLVFFEEEKIENVESEWSWTQVNEWPWSWVVINRHVLIYFTLHTNLHLTGFNSFSKIYSLSIFPHKSKLDQTWSCCKIGQGQIRVIIWTNWVVFKYSMLHTKFQGHRPFGSRELNHLKSLSFSHPMEDPHEIWLQSATSFKGKEVWKYGIWATLDQGQWPWPLTFIEVHVLI